MSRVAIVTGGGSGIGRATAERLVADGLDVATFDLGGDRPVDVTDPAAVAGAVAGVRERYGPVDVLVNAAGWPPAAVSRTTATWRSGSGRWR